MSQQRLILAILLSSNNGLSNDWQKRVIRNRSTDIANWKKQRTINYVIIPTTTNRFGNGFFHQQVCTRQNIL